MINHRQIEYRADIDGMRAIAVLAVVLYHFFPESLTGGFIGVDVFFVISGFLVTGIIFKSLNSGTFSVVDFYFKRVRRLFPSLVIVLAVTLVAGLILLLSDELTQLAKHILGGSIFASNFFLFSESGYFDSASELKPLLHLWSLSIEEQFYLIWPPLLLLAYKIHRNSLNWVLSVVVVCSFIANVVLTRDHAAFSFYMLPTRLWELGLGGLLALYSTRGYRLSRRAAHVVSLMGALMLLTGFVIIKKSWIFPGWWVLLAVMGTVLLIWSGPQALLNRWLSTKAAVYMGLISYPLYLWHWPIISFANISFAQDVPVLVKWLLLAAAFLLAILTYEFIEDPLRRQKATGVLVLRWVLPLVILGLIGAMIWKADGLPSRYPSYESVNRTRVEYRESLADADQATKCRENFFEIEMCSVSDLEKPPTVAIIGDSHANHLFPGLRDLYDAKGENLLLMARSGTSPLSGIVSKRSPDTSLEDVFEFILSQPQIKTVVLAAFWGNYYEKDGILIAGGMYKNRIQDTRSPDERDQAAVFRQGLVRTIDVFMKSGKRVIFFQDTPVLPFHLDRCRARPLVSSAESWDWNMDLDLQKQSGYRTVLADILQVHPHIQVVDLLPEVCEAGQCRVVRDNKMMFSDNFHLSIEGARRLFRRIENQYNW